MASIDSPALIDRYFPELTDSQRAAFGALGELYRLWNERINVVSRNDIDNIYTRHVVHSLAIAAFCGPLASGTRIVDLGCGGGFPGIPLAIMYPQCSFHLIDRIGKKVRVATEIASAIGLTNVSFQHGDSGECRQTFDYVVSRAVMQLDALVKASTHLIDVRTTIANRYAPGLICLKGGDLDTEAAAVRRPVIRIPVTDFFNDPFYDTKEIVYVPFRK